MSIRITDNYLSTLLVGDLNRSLNYLFDQQRMASTFQRVNAYADDPRAVGTIHRLNALLSRNDQYRDNVGRSRSIVDGTDTSLQTITDILADVRVLALRESSSMASDQTMTNSAVEVENLVNRLMEVLNTSIEGTHLFAGRNSGAAPFVREGGVVSYRGDDGEILAQTGPNSTLTLNIPGSVFMGTHSASLGGRLDLAPRLSDATLLTDLNLGNGWNAGSISIANGIGDVFKVDLTGALNIADVRERISTASGGAVTASINSNGNGLQLQGVGPLTVAEVGAGSTAASLGLAGTEAGHVLTGSDLRTNPGPDTQLDTIASLDGRLPLGTIQIHQPGGSTAVDLSGATTLGDLQTLIQSAVPGMELTLDANGLTLISSNPDSFQVSSADMSNTAASLSLAGQGTPTSLFGLLDDLQTALEAGDKDAVGGVVNDLLGIGRSVAALMVRTGGRKNYMDLEDNILLQRDERLRTQLSLESDADVAQVAANLSRAESSYQASLLVTSKLFENNLMMYLR